MGTRYSARYVMCTLLFSAPHYGFIHNVPRNREEWALFNLIGCLLYFCKYATNVNCSASPGFKGIDHPKDQLHVIPNPKEDIMKNAGNGTTAQHIDLHWGFLSIRK